MTSIVECVRSALVSLCGLGIFEMVPAGSRLWCQIAWDLSHTWYSWEMGTSGVDTLTISGAARSSPPRMTVLQRRSSFLSQSPRLGTVVSQWQTRRLAPKRSLRRHHPMPLLGLVDQRLHLIRKSILLVPLRLVCIHLVPANHPTDCMEHCHFRGGNSDTKGGGDVVYCCVILLV